jgi:hypothetical protein
MLQSQTLEEVDQEENNTTFICNKKGLFLRPFLLQMNSVKGLERFC